jgi:predicted DNA-binding protein with PD1-like motif
MKSTLLKIFLIANFFILLLSGPPIFKSKAETVSLRLHPNYDIISSLTTSLKEHNFTALSTSSAVGSVRSCWLRFANNTILTLLNGPFEITSLVGTFDKNL